MTIGPEAADREIVITRSFNAPRALVWKVFTEAEHIAKWWGPKGFTTTVKEQDLRPGGRTRYVMHGPDGKDYPCMGVFHEIVPFERYVTTDEFDEGIEDVTTGELPSGMILTVIFEDEGDGTRVTLRIMHPTVEDRRKHEEMGVVAGWNSSLDCLVEYLAGAYAVGTADREILISRLLDSPRELVWTAWTDPQQITHWWGPTGFTTTTHGMQVKPGGLWRFVMHGPDGRDYPNRVVFDEVVKPERLVYRHEDDESGVEPVRFTTTVTFEEQAGKTKLTMRMVFPSATERERVEREYGAVEGGLQTVARLAEHVAQASDRVPERLTLALPSEREIVLRRVFDAPRGVVFEAMSKPEHIRRWWGCGAHTMSVCEMDFRPGGAWHCVHREPNGYEHPFRGEYREIVPPERIVRTFIYDVEGIRDHPALETMTLEEVDGRTIMTTTVLHDSQQSRDGHFHSGMEGGASETMDRLAELVQSAAVAQ